MSFVVALALSGGLAGCGDELLTSQPLADPPKLPTLPEGWSEIKPGGETVCSRGSEYAYFVHPGTVNRVVIDFVGGGACWNAFTCSVADAIFTDSVDSAREAVLNSNPETDPGIYDRLNPDNPFKDWYHVVIPYCTGDVHWGNNEKTYDEGTAPPVTIKHRGAVNTRAVLDWVYENFSAPEHVFVTGCSAGSYGSAMWAPHVMEHYKGARVTQFGDSGAGIITEEFFRDSFPSWKADGAFPTFIPELDPAKVDLLELKVHDLYSAVGNYFPDHRVAQYNTAFDENQTFYFQAMGGGTAQEWSEQMMASIGEIEGRAPNFASFIPSGEQHCIIPYDNFYTVNVGGRRLVDWLRDLVDRGPLESPVCTECTAETP
jgi:hypothetical protein